MRRGRDGARELGGGRGERVKGQRKGKMRKGTETGTDQTPENHREDRTMDRRQPVKMAEQRCPRRTRPEWILAWRQAPAVCRRALFPPRPPGLLGRRTTHTNQPDPQKTEPRRDTKHCRPPVDLRVRLNRWNVIQTLGKVLHLGSKVNCTRREGGRTALSAAPVQAELEVPHESMGVCDIG